MSAAAWLLALVFGVWLLLTVLNQFRGWKLMAPIRRRDLFALVPSWTFFAPNPATQDVNVVIRDDLGSSKSPWRELDELAPSRWRWIWHPAKRPRKAVYDLAVSVGELLRDRDIEPELYSYDLAYLALLNHACTRHGSPVSQRRQFMVLRSRGYRDDRAPSIVFISWFHAL
ncbi:MAG: hypothetical protein IT196_27800 [Acidimicrobiales bacterium]|nr:hypothetical protein [Acidimicrobiales bacterium]